jgi:hypothetical protein
LIWTAVLLVIDPENPRMPLSPKKSTFSARCFLTGQRQVGAVAYSLMLGRDRVDRGSLPGSPSSAAGRGTGERRSKLYTGNERVIEKREKTSP